MIYFFCYQNWTELIFSDELIPSLFSGRRKNKDKERQWNDVR